MPYIGRAPSKSGAFRILDDISSGFNGSTVAFTLQVSSSNVNVVRDATLMIAVDGVMQEPGSAFTVSGSTITFGSAPLAGASFWGVELGDVGGISQASSLTANAITSATDLGAAPATADTLVVHDASAGAVKEMTVANLFTAPAITGNATAVTQSSGNNSTRIATTAYVDAAVVDDVLLSVTQNGHGFTIGDVLKVTSTDNVYEKARANNAANAEVVGVVSEAATNTFTLTISGEIATGGNVAPANVAAGTVLFLSQTTAGLLTNTEPSTTGEISKPVAIVTAQNAKIILLHYRGEEVSTGVQTNAPNDATYVTLSTNGSLTSERTLAAGSGITLTDAGANGAATISIANDAIDSQHYAAGSIDLEHMSSQSVDEDNLHISNAGNNGEFLSKQSGNAGGLTWAAVSSTPTSTWIPTHAMRSTTAESVNHYDYAALYMDASNTDTICVSGVFVAAPTAVKWIFMPTGQSGNIVYTLTTDYASVGQTMQTHQGSVGNTTLSVTSNTLQALDVNSYFSSAVAGDFFGMIFSRIGGNGSDTLNATLAVIGLLVEY